MMENTDPGFSCPEIFHNCRCWHFGFIDTFFLFQYQREKVKTIKRKRKKKMIDPTANHSKILWCKFHENGQL